MAGRDITSEQRHWLVSQMKDWQSSGIVSAEQTSRILELYESQEQLTERQQSAALTTLMGVAAFLVGLGVLLLIGYNWEAMPDALKLLIIFGVVTGTQLTALHLHFRREARWLSEVAFLMGCLFYGAGIFLVAQIFHLNAHYPDGIWWWAIGVLPFALCLETPLLHLLLAALLALWCGMEIIGFGNLGMWFFGRWGQFPNSALSLPFLALPGLMRAYRLRSPMIVALYVPLFAWWVILQPVAWELEAAIPHFVGAVGGLMLILAECHAAGSRFAVPYRLYGALLVAGVLMAMSFHDFNEHVVRSDLEFGSLLPALAIVALSGAAIAFSAVVQQRRSASPIAFKESLLTHTQRHVIPLGLVVSLGMLLLWQIVFDEPLLPTIVANLGMIALALWLMNVGLREDRGQPFAAGVLYFLLWAVVRYFDLFGDFGGMPGAAMMFFLCGAALFGVALYWRRRKQRKHGR
jgi:uncharacterized membrane protein